MGTNRLLTLLGPVSWAVLSCGGSILGKDAPVDTCGFQDLVAPKSYQCDQLQGDSMFRGICALDCSGNMFPTSVGGELQDLPGRRYYGVIFSPHPGHAVSLGDRTIRAFAGYNNINSPFNGHPEVNPNNALHTESVITEAGDLFVRIDKRLDGPTQLCVLQDFGDSGSYAWRSYAGGTPFAP